MKLVEIHDNVPLIITLLQQRMEKKEPVYLPLGTLRYYLQRLTYVPDEITAGYWMLEFAKDGHTTIRRITPETEHNWSLSKEIDPDGAVRWSMTLVG